MFSHKEDDKQERSCVCDEWHQLRLCYYLIKSIKSINWKSNSKIEKIIKEKLFKLKKLKRMIHFIQRKIAKSVEKKNISSIENIITIEASFEIIVFDLKRFQHRLLSSSASLLLENTYWRTVESWIQTSTFMYAMIQHDSRWKNERTNKNFCLKKKFMTSRIMKRWT
jgi:hypothetical protein